MTVTVSVNATYRLSRVEISSPHVPAGTVNGYSEILLESPSGEASAALASLRSTRGDAGKTLGIMPGDTISRTTAEAVNDTVDVDGVVFSFQDILKVLGLFFEKWRAEDAGKPEAETITPPPMPPLPGIMDVEPPVELSRPE